MKNLLFLCLTILLTACATTNNVIDHLYTTTNQNNLFYIDKNDTRYTAIQRHQNKLADNYLKHWFSPWTGKYLVNTLDEIKIKMMQVSNELLNNPGINFNRHPHTQRWIKNIIKNANMKHFPNLNKKAIIIHNVNMRNAPTNTPSFKSFTAAGQWYPFDTIQGSMIAANVPVKVLHVSRDGQWYFIITPHCYGWVPYNAVAFVNNHFIQKWQTGHYVMAIQDNASAFNDQAQLALKTRLGVLYPVEKITPHYYNVKVSITDSHQNAIIQIARLRKKQAHYFPIPIQPENIATMANKLIGKPYDWGSMYEYRDCSATQMDLFAPFGIWLPRNSLQQAEKGGTSIDLRGLSNMEKEKRIIQHATPFLTLIHLPGHIMLYVGHAGKHIYVFHTMWGLKTINLRGTLNRAVIGRTVITPIRFGQNYLNVTQTFLDRVDGMILLGNIKT